MWKSVTFSAYQHHLHYSFTRSSAESFNATNISFIMGLLRSLSFWTFLLIAYPSISQQLSFRQVGGAEGMISTPAHNCAIDHFGFFWIATNDGLVRYNGKETKTYYHQTHPGLPTDQIRLVYCDLNNHVWVCTVKGLVMLDEKRRFHKQLVVEDKPDAAVTYCFGDDGGNMFAITSEGAYSLSADSTSWAKAVWLDSLLVRRNFRSIRQFDAHRFIMVSPSTGVMIFNTKDQREEVFFPVTGISCATGFDENSILMGKTGQFELLHATFSDPLHRTRIAPPAFFQPNNLHKEIFGMVRAVDKKVYITTQEAGLLSLDTTLTHYTHYVHNPINPSTIISNSLRFINTDTEGNLFMTSSDGVTYTNVINNSIEYFNYIRDEKANVIDLRVVSIAEDKHKNLWVASRDNIYIYNPDSRIATAIELPSSIQFIADQLSPTCVVRDRSDQMWVSLRQSGIVIFDSEGKFKKTILPHEHHAYEKQLKHPRVIIEGPDEYMYVGSEDGIFRISQTDFRLDSFIDHPLLATLRKERIIDIIPLKESMWISSSPRGAVWRYMFEEKTLKKFNSTNGLSGDRIYSLDRDSAGNIYVGSFTGFSIITPDDKITNFEKGNELMSARIEALQTDDDGRVWMTNNSAIVRYDPMSGTLVSLGAREGLNNVTFSIMGSAKLSSGEIAFGSSRGFVIVDPTTINFRKKDLKVFIFYKSDDGDEIALTDQQVNLDYKHQNVKLSFAVNDMLIADKVLYRYRITENAPATWSDPSGNSTLDLNLNPGSYVIEVEAYYGHQWFSLEEPVHIRIRPPWWKEWWFILLLCLSGIGLTWLYTRGRIHKYKKEILISRQMADIESKALRAQMNPHFVFNSLNAIQECIVTGRIEEAYTYLSKFSRLLRMVLEHSDVSEVNLHEELEVLGLYVSLEKLRFKDDMHYQTEIDEELDPEEIWISPMLIQPHLENAVWHGLRHKEGDKILRLSIKELTPGYLEVTIEDNGIGRTQAAFMKQNRLGASSHKSKGKMISENRMALLKHHYPFASMTITDLYHADHSAAGTKVSLVVPMLNKNQEVKK